MKRICSFEPEDVYVDMGYRGHDYRGSGRVHIVGRGILKLALTLRRWFKRRSVVEAVISHSKNECRLARNYLLGSEGDRINAILCGCGYNIRRLLRAFIFWLWRILLLRRFCYRGPLTIMVAKQF